MNNPIDYTHLSKDELFDVLEQIDDEQHAENAKAAYLLLHNKFSITPQDLDERYQESGLLSDIVKLILFPLGSEQSLSKQDMQAKLQRINNSCSATV